MHWSLYQVYHSFHEEVRLYQQHWWRCNGPCQTRPPYFGMVKRAMNRAPGPTDFWWKDHQATCGGQYIKVREPDGFSEKKAKQISRKGNFNKILISKKWVIEFTQISHTYRCTAKFYLSDLHRAIRVLNY